MTNRQRHAPSLPVVAGLLSLALAVARAGQPDQPVPQPASAALAVLVVMPPAGPPPVPLDLWLGLQGVAFHLTSANQGSINELTIAPAGLAIDNRPIVRQVDGQVVRAEVADLNGDASPEVYVYVRSAGSGSYGSLVAYGANRRKSLSEIHLPPLTGSPAARGYMGHDEFAVVDHRLVRRFPVYREGDANAAPSGGMRQLQYSLKPGEAGWRLQLERMDDY